MGSGRNFGLVFAVIFAAISVWPALIHAEPIRWWALGLAICFLLLAVFAQERLAPFNRSWFKAGLATNRVLSPLIMGLLFFCVVTPMGLILRMFGMDMLRLERSEATSYWIDRKPPGPAEGSMKNQF